MKSTEEQNLCYVHVYDTCMCKFLDQLKALMLLKRCSSKGIKMEIKEKEARCLTSHHIPGRVQLRPLQGCAIEKVQ